jgi:NAD(P)H-dependent FMN reductase
VEEEMSKSGILVVSSSLNPCSRSRILARAAYDHLCKKDDADWLDLQDFSLPMCDGGSCYGHADVIEVGKRIKEASCILVATPVYNFDVNAALKNLIELTGDGWSEKSVGFMCAAGGKSSYMSVMGVANSLMLDFRSVVIPRFVYADGGAFDGDEIKPEVMLRIEELCHQALRFSSLLSPLAK